MIIVFIATFFVNIIVIILTCGVFGIIYNRYIRKRVK